MAPPITKSTASALLGVANDASQDEIRRAWRVLALKSHPDKNPDDAAAAARFREVTDAYRCLATGTVEIKSYEELCAEMDDTRAALLRAMEIAKRQTDGHAKPAAGGDGAKDKILRMGAVTWIGEVEGGRPDGVGDLILANGSVHHGTFAQGRASGAGTFFDATGSVMRGEWIDNKRVGAFVTTDPKGGTWHDNYDAEGKRTARKRGEPPPEGTAAAVKCMHCGAKFHEALNVRCLQHSGKWMEAPTHNADGSAATVDRVAFPEGGLWLCCGSKSKAGGGCSVGMHGSEAPPPAVPEERRIGAPAAAGTTRADLDASSSVGSGSKTIPSFIESSFPTLVEYTAWRRSLRGA